MTKLHDLFEQQGQSPWIDNLKRGYLTGGQLADLVGQGIRGVTSNPTIFQKAMADSADYDDQFNSLVEKERKSVEHAYWDMVAEDISDALAVLRPVYDASEGRDGFVSLEVAPSLAPDTQGTIQAARNLHERIDQANLFVKIPATEPGIPAIEQMIAEGRNINVTLIFSLERYDAVIEAYLSGLEAFEGDLSQVTSVASFFVSRVDTEVDRRLETIGTEEALALRGKAAVAQAKMAYQLFLARFSGPRWEALEQRGARVQRPLWASTSTKNPEYDDLLYVNSLIGDNSVNTMPDKTIDAFLEHGVVERTIDKDVEGAKATLDELAEVGVDMSDVSRQIEDEGVSTFSKSFDELMQVLNDKADELTQ
ncbi:MAG: transaldolase [Actinobacteria bacterium]|nr:transaldolase [Actinomycetota bacterium]